MLSMYGLDLGTYDERKIVKESSYSPRWSTVEKDINLINKYHYTPVTLENGYRAGKNIVSGAKWILIDVDEAGDNVEEKLQEYKLSYIKAPSGSASDEVNYKWHYFVKTERLSNFVAMARAQIQDFYNALKLENVDPTAIDPARYFAPCGCGEVMGSDAWEKRIKWCNEKTVVVTGNAWVPSTDVTPIYSGSGKPIYISIEADGEIDVGDQWEPTLEARTTKNGVKNWFLEADTPISIGKDRWITVEKIAEKIGDGETVSNLIGCPGYSHAHDDPSRVGYGYVSRKKEWVFFSCGGNSCKGQAYSYKDKKWQKVS